jgi:hypothetical protein
MSERVSRRLEIALEPQPGTSQPPLGARLEPHRAGVTCTVGTGRQCDIVLPRPPYLTIGQVACRFRWLGDDITLDPTDRQAGTLAVDGAPFAGGPLAPGEHLLELGGHRFRLTLAFVDDG